jgi:endonuclease/exonuclease/phosphatase family metal-dependent hydrolase
MPCEGANTAEYDYVLQEISYIIASQNVLHVICVGDFNTDLTRLSMQTQILNDFLLSEDLCSLRGTDVYKVDYTFESLSNHSMSCIDHFFVSKNLVEHVRLVSVEHTPRNMSDHSPISMELDIKLHLTDSSIVRKPKMLWSQASAQCVQEYRSSLERVLESGSSHVS